MICPWCGSRAVMTICFFEDALYECTNPNCDWEEYMDKNEEDD